MKTLEDKIINELLQNGWNMDFVVAGSGHALIVDILKSAAIKDLKQSVKFNCCIPVK